MEDIQRLVDRLGRELKRGVGIEDHRFRHITHSAHQGDADWLRSEAILNRETPQAARDWFRTFDIDKAKEWLRIPANPDMEIAPRLCVPVRFADQLLGHLWIIEREMIPERQLRTIRKAADSAGVFLYRTRMIQQVEQGLEREGLRDLLDDSPAVRQQAATHLFESDLFRSGVPACAAVCTSANTDSILDDSLRASVDAVFSRTRASLDRRDLLYLVRPDHAVALIAVGPEQIAINNVAERLRARLAGAGPAAAGMVIAIGSPKARLDRVRESYDEALRAAQIAYAFPSQGGVVSWDDLGVYRLLSQVARTSVDEHALHSGVITLLHGIHGKDRLRILETYLDRGCDAAATASELGVHRASVYLRLAKIEQTMGISLRNGLDRLAVHMSVKLIRLAGVEAKTATAK